MININENDNSDQAKGANGPVSVAKLKEYGKQAYAPIVNVLYKYQDEFTPYLGALVKGLQGGAESLNREGSSEAEKYVSQFFTEAADGLGQASEKLDSKDINSITSFLSEQAERRPSVMFSTSYVAGIILGRLGRHIARSKADTSISEETSSINDSLH